MKRTIYFILFLIFGHLFATSQIVPSSCVPQDSNSLSYKNDAIGLTLQRIFKNNSSYKDSIEIPKSSVDTVYKALVAIYNAKKLAARDTIIEMYAIHSFATLGFNTITIAADTNLVWMKNIRNNIIPFGYSSIDSLIVKYKFRLLNNVFGYNYSTLISDSSYNIIAMQKAFQKIPGIIFADLSIGLGDGNTIKDSIYTDHAEIVYSLGWGDCPSGCIYRRFWKFNVYWNCSVEFVSSYGDLIYPVSTNDIEKKSATLFPNPFKDDLYIEGLESKFNYTIFNLYGQELVSGISIDKIEHLDSLNNGVYYLQLKTDNKILTRKIIKE